MHHTHVAGPEPARAALIGIHRISAFSFGKSGQEKAGSYSEKNCGIVLRVNSKRIADSVGGGYFQAPSTACRADSRSTSSPCSASAEPSAARLPCTAPGVAFGP